MKRLVDEKKRVHYERCSNKSIKEHVAGQWYRAFAMALSSNNEVEWIAYSFFEWDELLKCQMAIDSQGIKSSSLSGLEGENMLLVRALGLQIWNDANEIGNGYCSSMQHFDWGGLLGALNFNQSAGISIQWRGFIKTFLNRSYPPTVCRLQK